MLEIERADPQCVADSRQHRRGRRRLPDELHVALRGDQRVERVEEDADRSREPHALALFPGRSSKRARADCNCSESADCWRIVAP